MIRIKAGLGRAAAATALAFTAALAISGTVQADERRHDERHREIHEFRTPHWVFDQRFHHDHYYPAIGYAVSVLPPGYVSVAFGGRHFYFQGGVWFAPAARGYVVVRPPLGVIVPVLPPAYTVVWVGSVPYYYANDVFYVAVRGGYQVVAPPPEAAYVEAPAAPTAPPAPQSPRPPTAAPSAQTSAGVWYYCESAKAYYPYASECPEGWRTVPAAPPPGR